MSILKLFAWFLGMTASFDVAYASSFVNVSITGLGIVQGTRSKDNEVFRGIPFAEAPVGDLRFKPPKPAKWSGFRNATQFASMCPQRDYFSKRLILNEDCLYLDIYRPVKRSGKLAVMVWIHGGSFIFGGASEFDGRTLAGHQGVIVVTIQYRLGILGFFNIPNTAIKGNFGMLDQIEALRWVKKNIADFGGDPTKVTIFGESAGGGSVSLLTVSPMIRNEKLFVRAIAQSGVASNFWAAVPQAKDVTVAGGFGKLVQCNDVEKLVACLKAKTTKELLLKQEMLDETKLMLMAPTLDGEFLTELPSKLVARNAIPKTNVSLMLGFNANEGTFFAGEPRSSTKQSYEDTVRWGIKWYFGKDNKVLERAIIHEYTRYSTSNQGSKWFGSTSDFYADTLFDVDIVRMANAWVHSGNTAYTYFFSHLPENLTRPHLEVTHTLDLLYTFGYAYKGVATHLQDSYTVIDRNVSAMCMEMWGSFAKRGAPGKGWPEYSLEAKKYLNIKHPLTVQSQLWSKRMAFWNKVVPQILNGTAPHKCEDGIKASSTRLQGLFILLFSSFLWYHFLV